MANQTQHYPNAAGQISGLGIELLGRPGFYFQSGDPIANPNPAPAPNPNPEPAPNPNPPNPNPAPPANTGDAEKKFTQADLDRIAGQTREEEKKKFEREQQRIKDEADAEKLKTQGQFEQLYNAEKQKTTDLESRLTGATALSTKVHASIDAEVANWPDSVKKSDPGKDSDVTARLAWADSHRDLAAELSNRQAPNGEHGSQNRGGGNGNNNGGAGGGSNNNYDPVAAHIGARYTVPGRPQQQQPQGQQQQNGR